MVRSVSWVLLVVVAVAVFLGGFGVGYLVAPSANPTTQAESTTLSITAAGTLNTLFPAVANVLVNQTPGISAPTASQSYQGSLAALAAITQQGGRYDIAAAADYRLIPQLLEPQYASFEAVFGTTPEALAYNASVYPNLNTSNWAQTLMTSGKPLAFANASTDPNGYNEIFVVQLQGLLQSNDLSAVYSYYFTTPVGALAVPNTATTQIEPETQAASLIQHGYVSAFIIYQSYAISHHLAYVPLDPRVSLGSFDPADLALYGEASTSILTATGTETIHGAPVAFSVTVPLNAPNTDLGVAFVNLLLSPQGSGMIAAAGFTPVFPAYSDHPDAAPPLLQPDLIPLPPALALPAT